MIEQREMMKVVEKLRGNAIVLPTMTGNGAWLDVTQNQDRDVSIGGAMGKASTFALGLAMAQPDTNIIVFDGDGSLEMNLGTLATIAGKKPIIPVAMGIPKIPAPIVMPVISKTPPRSLLSSFIFNLHYIVI